MIYAIFYVSLGSQRQLQSGKFFNISYSPPELKVFRW
jgi:hypothetical protein